MPAEEFFGSVEEFVEYCEGDHIIKKVLIANNGIGALKAIRSVRKWAYQTFGNERMVVYSMFPSNCNCNRACNSINSSHIIQLEDSMT